MHEFTDLKTTMDQIIAYEQMFRQRLAKTMTPEKLAALESDPPNECPNCGAALADGDSFCDDECKDAWWGIDRMQIERERIAARREDAAEARHALAREEFEKQLDKMTDLAIEARRLERTGNHE